MRIGPFQINVGRVRAQKKVVAEERISKPNSGDFYSFIQKLPLMQIRQMVHSWLNGDWGSAYDLCAFMLDSWPVCFKNQHELRDAIRATRFKAMPYRENEDAEPTASAIEKANFVNAALKSFRPEPGTDEKDFPGTVYHSCNALILPTIQEIFWQQSEGDIVPRATAWVHSRQMGFARGGKLTVRLRDAEAAAMHFNPSIDAMYAGDELPAHKFLFSIFDTRSGAITTSGLMRPLCWWWGAMMYGREWLVRYAEMFGQPLRKVLYDKERMDADTLATVKEMLADMGASPWIAIPNASEFEWEQFKGTGIDDPKRYFVEKGDEYANLIFFGGTLTSQTAQQSGAIRGNSEVQNDTRTKREEGIAAWQAQLLTAQLARSIIALNWGDDRECPTIEPDFTEPLGAIEQANVVEIWSRAGWTIKDETEASRLSSLPLAKKEEPEPLGGFGFPANGNGSRNGKPKTETVKARAAAPMDLADAVAADFSKFTDRLDALATATDPDAFADGIEKLQKTVTDLRIDPRKSALAEQLEAAMAGAVMRALESSSSSTKPVSTAEAVRP